jgi:hypothetical protein
MAGTILKDFGDAQVYRPRLLAGVGAVTWVIVAALYIAAATDSKLVEWQKNAWWILFGFHLVEAILVFFEAKTFRGTFWPFSTLVIGNALFITVYAAVLHGVCLVEKSLVDATSPWENSAVRFSGVALIFAVLGNSMMVGALWSYFHKKVGTGTVASRAAYRIVQ